MCQVVSDSISKLEPGDRKSSDSCRSGTLGLKLPQAAQTVPTAPAAREPAGTTPDVATRRPDLTREHLATIASIQAIIARLEAERQSTQAALDKLNADLERLSQSVRADGPIKDTID